MAYETDLQLVDRYIDTCLDFINPQTLRAIQSRGLYNIINYLPMDKKEAKAIARSRLAQMGKFFGDDEIDAIAGKIQRLESLKKALGQMNMADAHKVLPLITEMKALSKEVLDYYK